MRMSLVSVAQARLGMRTAARRKESMVKTELTILAVRVDDNCLCGLVFSRDQAFSSAGKGRQSVKSARWEIFVQVCKEGGGNRCANEVVRSNIRSLHLPEGTQLFGALQRTFSLSHSLAASANALISDLYFLLRFRIVPSLYFGTATNVIHCFICRIQISAGLQLNIIRQRCLLSDR